MFFLAKIVLGFFDKFTQDQIFKFIKTVLNNKINTLLDVGSHCGEYINSINSKFKIDKIFGFEPNPKSYEILIKKIKNLNNVEAFNFAVGKDNEILTLNQNIESSSSSINQINENSKYFKRKYFFFNFLKKKKIYKSNKNQNSLVK